MIWILLPTDFRRWGRHGYRLPLDFWPDVFPGRFITLLWRIKVTSTLHKVRAFKPTIRRNKRSLARLFLSVALGPWTHLWCSTSPAWLECGTATYSCMHAAHRCIAFFFFLSKRELLITVGEFKSLKLHRSETRQNHAPLQSALLW